MQGKKYEERLDRLDVLDVGTKYLISDFSSKYSNQPVDFFKNNLFSIFYFLSQSTPESALLPTDWLPLEANTPRHLKIYATNSAMVNQPMPFHERLSFWKGLHEKTLVKDEL